jgi:hypothetical protein
MLVYLTNAGKRDYIEFCRQNYDSVGIGYLANHWMYPKSGVRWFLDNGAFHAWKNKKNFDSNAFLETLWKLERCCSEPDFIVAPDIVMGGKESLDFSLSWFEKIPGGYKTYLAVQDGMATNDVVPCIESFDGVFIGGGIQENVVLLREWVDFSHSHGMPVHIGRAGTKNKLKNAMGIGADSVDSSTFVQTNRNRKYGQYTGLVQLAEILEL